MKLVQKRFLQGRREFEIVDDAVHIRLKSPLKEENQTIPLAVLNPEPVESGDYVEFHGRVKGHHALLSLLLDKPNARDFNAFVDELKRRAREEYHLFAGLKGGRQSPQAAAEQDAAEKHAYRRPARPVDPGRIDDAMRLLQQYLDGSELETLLAALEALRAAPEAESSMARLVHAFDELGTRQGAVLTYAPYVGVLLSDDPFGD